MTNPSTRRFIFSQTPHPVPVDWAGRVGSDRQIYSSRRMRTSPAGRSLANEVIWICLERTSCPGHRRKPRLRWPVVLPLVHGWTTERLFIFVTRSRNPNLFSILIGSPAGGGGASGSGAGGDIGFQVLHGGQRFAKGKTAGAAHTGDFFIDRAEAGWNALLQT